jgi:hypothetical protein
MAPRYYENNTIFVDLDSLMDRLRQETQNTYPSGTSKQEEHELMSLDGITHTMRYHLVKAQIDKAISSIKIFSSNNEK